MRERHVVKSVEFHANSPACVAGALPCQTDSLAVADPSPEKNALRRGGGETPMVLDELAEVIPDNIDLEKQVELKELGKALRKFVAGLDDTEAQIFLARCWYMTGVKEIAEKFGITPGNVSTTLHRTRRKLQKYLKEEGLC